MSISQCEDGSSRKPAKNRNHVLDEMVKKVPEHVCFYVEQELSAYRTYKEALAQLELDLGDIINQYGQVPADAISSRTGPGDPVNLSALRALMIEEKIKYYQSRLRRIESGISLLSKFEKAVATRKYFVQDCCSNEEIIEELNINRHYFYKIRQDVISKFATVFGIL